MRKNAFRIKKTWQGVVVGSFFGIAVTFACILLLASVLVRYDIPIASVKYLLFVPAVLSGLASGGITGKFVHSKGFLWGFAASLSVAVILVLVLLSVNSFNVNMLIFLLIPAYAVPGSVGGIIASNLK